MVAARFDSRSLVGWVPRGGLLFICLILFASKVVWYDLRVVYSELRGDAFRILLGSHAAVLLPFTCYALVRGRQYVAKSPVTLGVLAIMISGLLVAIVGGIESYQYLVQDIVKWTFLPTAFLLAIIDRPRNIERFMSLLAHCVLVMQVMKFGLLLLSYDRAEGLYFGYVIDVFPYCVYASSWLSGHRPLNAALAIIACLIVVCGQKRANLISLVVVSFVLLFMYRDQIRERIGRVLVAAAVVGGTVFSSSQIASTIDSRLSRPVPSQISRDASVQNRLKELESVWEKLDNGGPIRTFFGFGHGASIANPKVSSPDLVRHSVHLTPAALHLRYGLLGAAYFLFLAIRVCFLLRRSDNACSGANALKGFGLAALGSSLVEYGFVDDMLIGLLLGLHHTPTRVEYVETTDLLGSTSVEAAHNQVGTANPKDRNVEESSGE